MDQMLSLLDQGLPKRPIY